MTTPSLADAGRRSRVALPSRDVPAARQVERRRPWWFVGALLYGVSWPLVDGVNLSFLAWGAFVPLLLDLERHDRFAPFALRVLGFMGLATLIYCWWWFFAVPKEVQLLTWIGGAHEILLESTPLLLLYPLRRAMGYGQALCALVLVWPLWEWVYNHWEFSMGYLLLAYSQAGNVWLVQYADLFGAWAITAWVVLFNVLLVRAYREHAWSRAFGTRALAVAAVLLAVPLAYAGVRSATVASDGALRVAAVYTDFDPVADREGGRRIERVTHLSDSLAYFASAPPDLYAWPEGGIPYGWTPESRAFLRQAVADWQAPLLTGHLGEDAQADGDTARFNRAVLLAPGAEGAAPSYDKRRFVPFHEGLPHGDMLGVIPAVAAYRDRERLLTPGPGPTLLAVETQDGRTVRVATPICHEQQFPGLWAEWVREGADVFVHLSFESWFGDATFQHHFLNISRLRAIESRRSVVRVSNGGPTAVIDAFGRVGERGGRSEGAITGLVGLHEGLTLYAFVPWLFPALCAFGIVGLLARPSIAFGGASTSRQEGLYDEGDWAPGTSSSVV